MVDDAIFALALAAALGSGLIAGTFFAFSTFVMRALAQSPSAEGVRAMQAINLTVINPLFMAAFMGTALISLTLAVLSVGEWEDPESIYLLAGGALHLFGTFGVSIAFNVPLNDRLAPLDPESPEAAEFWPSYISRWTAWNHVRTLASLAAAASFTVALT